MAWLARLVFETVGGQALLGVAGLAALVAWWQIDRMVLTQHARTEGARHVVVKSREDAQRIRDAIREAQDGVLAAPGDPRVRLRERYCVDC